MDNSFYHFLLENLTLRIFMTTRQTISVYHKNEILMKEKILKEQTLELENKIEQHKKKSLKLLERENKVSVKESIETMQNELLNISVSISQLLDVINEPILESRIQQIIHKLNEIKNTRDEILDQPVIVATEVMALV